VGENCPRGGRKDLSSGVAAMAIELHMIYWKGEKFWVGKLLELPEIMTQGETLGELEANIREAYTLMMMDD
jgi:predicted RNase H-like HicB family nuclease